MCEFYAVFRGFQVREQPDTDNHEPLNATRSAGRAVALPTNQVRPKEGGPWPLHELLSAGRCSGGRPVSGPETFDWPVPSSWYESGFPCLACRVVYGFGRA